MISKRDLLFAAIAIASLSTITHADILSDPPRPIEIIEIFDDGTFTIKDDRVPRSYRLWGVEPNVEYLREFIKGKEIECRDSGETLSPTNRRVSILNCYISYDGEWPLIAEHLVQSGKGRELCFESQNRFKTCQYDKGQK